MNEVLELNSDKLKKEIRKKIVLYEDMIKKNYEEENYYDIREYATILFYDVLPTKEYDVGKKTSKNNLSNINNQKGGEGNNNNFNSFGNNNNINNENETNENQRLNNNNRKNEDENENENENKNGEEVPNEINKKKMTKSEAETLRTLYKDPEGAFENYFDNLFSHIENEANDELVSIKEKYSEILAIKYAEIQNKLNNCNKKINFFESIYIQMELKEKIPLTGVEKIKFTFDDNLIFNESNYRASELFGRYIFSVLISDEESNNSKRAELSIPNNFYKDDIFENVTEDFARWDKLLQFWLFYVLLVKRILANKVDIEEITNYKFIFELAKRLRSFEKTPFGSKKKLQKQKQKQKQQFKKRQFGGQELSIDNEYRQIRSGNTKTSRQNLSPDSLKFKELMKKMVFRKQVNEKKNDEVISFYQYFNSDELRKKIEEFYKTQIKDKISLGERNIERQKVPCDLSLPYFSDKGETFQLQSILNCSYQKGYGDPTREFKIVMDKIKNIMSIFQTLYSYTETNGNRIRKFADDLRKETLFFYFFIYYKKKFIYTKYLHILQQQLEKKGVDIPSFLQKYGLRINNHTKSNIISNLNSKNNTNMNTNKNKNLNRKEINKLENKRTKKEKEYQTLLNKINLLKKKKEELNKNKNTKNYDEKILIIDKLIHELILKKRNYI